MENTKPSHAVANFKPRRSALLVTIRRIATDSAAVAFSSHALERMDERGITTLDVLRSLRTGEIVGEIEAGKSVGEWKCKIVERRRRAREIGVATLVIKENKLLVKTAEWEDL